MASNNEVYLVVHRFRPNDVHSAWAKREDALHVGKNLGEHEWCLRTISIALLDDHGKVRFDQCSVLIQLDNSK